MSKVILMCGAPGTGKSTLTNELIEAHKKESGNNPHSFTQVCSADKFFTDRDGKYTFDREKLGEAHRACLNHFMSVVSSDHMGLTIVDNTNCHIYDVIPYVAIALARGREVEIISLKVKNEADLIKCAERNVHGVPLSTIRRMHESQLKMKPIPHWAGSVALIERYVSFP